MTKLLPIYVLIFALFSCSRNKSTDKSQVNNVNDIDTVDVNLFKPKQQSKEFQYYFCDKNGNKIKPEFYFGDTLIIKMFYNKKISKNYTDFNLGITARTNINSIKKLSKNKFQLILNEKNNFNAFYFEPYISSKKIVFEDSNHDILKGFSKNEFSHSFSWSCYTFTINEKN